MIGLLKSNLVPGARVELAYYSLTASPIANYSTPECLLTKMIERFVSSIYLCLFDTVTETFAMYFQIGIQYNFSIALESVLIDLCQFSL